MTPTGIDLVVDAHFRARSRQNILQMTADMARAVDYVGQLLILLYVAVGMCGLISLAFLLDRCREHRRRQRLDLFYAQMHGVCPDYR
jgi:predicted GNAT superfamily acetyltransferase